MTDEETQQLAQLLRKASAEGLGVPRLPAPAFAALKGVVAQPTVELLVTSNQRDVLLTFRADKHWSTWHLPGGFVGAGESLDAACTRIAERELGVPAVLERIVGHYTWNDHPWATPLSLLCLCKLVGAPGEGRFFEPLPENLMEQHRALLERSWPEPG